MNAAGGDVDGGHAQRGEGEGIELPEDEHVDYFVETPTPTAKPGDKVFELPTEAPEMLMFYAGVMVALMSAHTPFGAYTRAFINTAADRRAFVALVLDFLIREIFEKVEPYEDIAKLSTPPTRLKDCRHACGYANFAVFACLQSHRMPSHL